MSNLANQYVKFGKKKILANLAIFKNFFRIFKGPLRHTLLLRKLKRCKKWLKTVEILSLAFLKKFWKFFQNESFSPFFGHFQIFFWIFKGPLGHTLLLSKLWQCQNGINTVEISSLAFLKKFKHAFQNESLFFWAILAIFKNFFRIFKGPLRHTLLLRKLKWCQKYLKTIKISSLAFLKNSKFVFQNESFSNFFKKIIFRPNLTLCVEIQSRFKKKFLTFWIFERFLPRHFLSQILC